MMWLSTHWFALLAYSLVAIAWQGILSDMATGKWREE
jgi:hypothetical protein